MKDRIYHVARFTCETGKQFEVDFSTESLLGKLHDNPSKYVVYNYQGSCFSYVSNRIVDKIAQKELLLFGRIRAGLDKRAVEYGADEIDITRIINSSLVAEVCFEERLREPEEGHQ